MHRFFPRMLSFSLLMVSHLTSATVSTNFKDCNHFFYMQTPPAGISGTSLKRICQKYADKLRYATLYDSSRHLPLYSAYIFKKSDGKSRMDTPWMYEPQVERAPAVKPGCFWPVMMICCDKTDDIRLLLWL